MSIVLRLPEEQHLLQCFEKEFSNSHSRTQVFTNFKWTWKHFILFLFQKKESRLKDLLEYNR